MPSNLLSKFSICMYKYVIDLLLISNYLSNTSYFYQTSTYPNWYNLISHYVVNRKWPLNSTKQGIFCINAQQAQNENGMLPSFCLIIDVRKTSSYKLLLSQKKITCEMFLTCVFTFNNRCIFEKSQLSTNQSLSTNYITWFFPS